MSQRSRSSYIAAAATAALSLLSKPGIALAEIHLDSSPQTNTPTLIQALREQVFSAPPKVLALDIHITIGAKALRLALDSQDRQPIIAAYISSVDFATVMRGYSGTRLITAVYSDPDPLDQLALAKAIVGRANVGVFDSPDAHALVTRLTQHGVTAIPVMPNERTDALLRSADPFGVIIATPDPTILNRANIGHVVRHLYQQRKVLIGFSDTLTQVGSLGSVYPTTDAIAHTVTQVLEQYAQSGNLLPPIFVADVQVSTNEQLARSLDIILPEPSALLTALRDKNRALQ